MKKRVKRCMFGNFFFFLLFLSSADFFFKTNFFSKYFLTNTMKVSSRLNPDQGRLSVGADRGLNCLQRLSADDKSPSVQEMS